MKIKEKAHEWASSIKNYVASKILELLLTGIISMTAQIIKQERAMYTMLSFILVFAIVFMFVHFGVEAVRSSVKCRKELLELHEMEKKIEEEKRLSK